jgi:gluconolactonase
VPPRYPPIRISDIGTPVLIGNQFTFSEGPVWDPTKGVLFFSDITANRIYRLTLPSTFDVFHAPSNQTDGLALDVQGNLIAAEFGTRSVARLVGAGESTLANQYMAKKLNTPDDLISRSDGIVYFTDPGFGLGAGGATYGLPTNTVSELGFDGVYRLLPDGTLYLEDQSSGQAPNGVELSPDERTLYVSYTRTGQIVSFDVATDGSLSNKVPFSQPLTGADSMCVDAAGNVYVAGSSSGNGIGIYQGNGTWIGGIPRPSAQVPTNCAFGGVDQKTLFITARKEIYRIDNMPIPGMPGRP